VQIDAEELLNVVPGALAVTSGADHVVDALSTRGAQLLGAVSDGRPLRESLPPGKLLEALDAVRRTGEATGVPGLALPAPEAPGCVRVTPVGDGLLLRLGPDELEDGAARAAGFRQLTEQLSRALTPEDIGRLTATTAAELIGADACAAYGREDGAAVLTALHDQGLPGTALRRFTQVTLHRGRPMSDAVLTGEPVWLEDADQWHARYPEMAPIGVSEGIEATACLPLRVEERDLGAVVFSFYRPRAFDSAEREFLVTVAALCAQALDRARLYTAEHQARADAERERDRMAFLAQASNLMEAPLSVEERLRQLGDLVVEGVADWSAVHLVRGTRVERVTVAHLDPVKVAFVEELERRYPPDPDAPGGAIEVARSGVPVVMSDVPDELLVASARDATHLELIRAIGLRSAIVVPLLVRGRSLGALTLVHAESGERFTDEDLTFVGQLAATAALALDNAALYEQQRLVARTLQTALLPSELPDVPGVSCAGRYRPPSPDLTDVYVGGDLYDVHEDAERGRWALTVADVCGKGPEAAALTALIRHTVHAEVGHGLGPAEVLRRVNAAMLRHRGGNRARFATMAHAAITVDAAGVAVSLVNGGHPPAVILRHGAQRTCRAGGETLAGDRVEWLEVPGTLVGVYPDVDLDEVRVRLDPGDALLLYTDGVTEARSPDGWFGSERLASLVASLAGASADEIADGVLTAVTDFQGGRLRDDVALLVVRVDP
jgi:serine phosphatase RsbU (regulator of sigma subunit)